MIIRAKAPLRLSFAGGGTDVAPFKDEEGGCVLTTTITQYVYATLHQTDQAHIKIHSLDYDIVSKYTVNQKIRRDSRLSLAKATIQRMNERDLGADIFIHSDAPPGSGLGSSSTMVVTIIGLFRELFKKPLSNYEMAEMAYLIERVDLQMLGGMQDQYAAAFGGFNFIEFYQDRVIVNPLRINATALNELHYNLLLCSVGRTRLSETIIAKQVDNYRKSEKEAVDAMRTQKAIAIEMKNCLLLGKLNEFAALLDYAWLVKKRMAKEISNPVIDAMYEEAKKNGAIGGKILGAGGGGYLVFYCSSGKKHLIARALEKMGGRIVDFGFETNGLQAWTAEPNRSSESYVREWAKTHAVPAVYRD